jgi:hypothetical protein
MCSCLVAFMFMVLDGLTLMPLYMYLTAVIARAEYLRFNTTHLILSKIPILYSVPGIPLEHETTL